MPKTMTDIPDLLRRLAARERRLRTLAEDPHAVGNEQPDAALLREVQVALAQMQQERWFPVTLPITSKQAERSGPSQVRIPWSVAEKAYAVYAGRYGHEQSLEQIAKRGGFYAEELDALFPGWREEADEITQLRASIQSLVANADQMAQAEKALQAKLHEAEAQVPRWDDWTPTAEAINALPEPLRRYIHDLETNCDPAGNIRELALARDTIKYLEAQVLEARDHEARAALGRMEQERDGHA